MSTAFLIKKPTPLRRQHKGPLAVQALLSASFPRVLESICTLLTNCVVLKPASAEALPDDHYGLKMAIMRLAVDNFTCY
jgi:hypothetical protein